LARCDCAGAVAIIFPRRDVSPSRKPSDSLRPLRPVPARPAEPKAGCTTKAAGC
jgi:hypothetical protein